MPWIIGIDEAGYGPNLGPLVMTSVACQVNESPAQLNLWQRLQSAVRQGTRSKASNGRGTKPRDDRLLVDDSKLVYASGKGLSELERSVLGILWRGEQPAVLDGYLTSTCSEGLEDLRKETWYRGTSPLPGHILDNELVPMGVRFDQACREVGVTRWVVQSAIICPGRFNSLLQRYTSKGAVLEHALIHLLGINHQQLTDDSLTIFVDKHGGRNTYAAMIQHALPGGMVMCHQEGALCSAYRIMGLKRSVQLQFQPRADTTHFVVALASMTSKYIREMLMHEFNAFWQQQVPGLPPTAGYPADARRFMEAIRPVLGRLQLHESTLWREK